MDVPLMPRNYCADFDVGKLKNMYDELIEDVLRDGKLFQGMFRANADLRKKFTEFYEQAAGDMRGGALGDVLYEDFTDSMLDEEPRTMQTQVNFLTGHLKSEISSDLIPQDNKEDVSHGHTHDDDFVSVKEGFTVQLDEYEYSNHYSNTGVQADDSMTQEYSYDYE
jgi:hypothetical protein